MTEQTNNHTKSLAEIGLSQFAPYLMNRIMGRWNVNLLEQLRPHNQTPVKLRTLAVLSIMPGLTINELSIYTVAEQSTMSRSLDALEAQGLIKRISSDADGRVRKVYLTEKGSETFDRLWPIMYDGETNLMENISAEEQKQLIGTLQKMLSNIQLPVVD